MTLSVIKCRYLFNRNVIKNYTGCTFGDSTARMYSKLISPAHLMKMHMVLTAFTQYTPNSKFELLIRMLACFCVHCKVRTTEKWFDQNYLYKTPDGALSSEITAR